MKSGRSEIYRKLALYVAVVAAAGWTGYWLNKRPNRVTNLYYVREPKVSPDEEIIYSTFSPPTGMQLVSRDVALIRERTSEGKFQVMYYAPKRPYQWGSVEIEFRWNPALTPNYAILEPNLHIFGRYDTSALGELAVASETTNNRWIILGTFGGTEDHVSISKGFDVSRWIKGARSLRVRYRLKASRLMYHPTPDDPVGYAGAQCLRQSIDNENSMRLALWKDRSDIE